MKKIFYMLWSDAINYERIKNGGESHWKLFTFVYMSIFLSLNILSLLSAVLYFTGYDILSKIITKLQSVLSSEFLVNLLWTTLVLFIPSVIINYFLVFHKNKYEYILANYKFKNGKILLIYFCLTVIAFFGFSLLNKFG